MQTVNMGNPSKPALEVGQKVFVIDRVDNRKRLCKVVKVLDDTEEIRVHYVDWNEKWDENLPYNSPRLLLDEDSDEHDDKDQDE